MALKPILQSNRVTMAHSLQNPKLLELVTTAGESYESLVKGQGEVFKLTELLSPAQVVEYPHLTELLLPKRAECTSEAFEVHNERYKRLTQVLNNLVTNLNTTVADKGEGILDEIASFRRWYELSHTIYLLAHLTIKLQTLYVNQEETLAKLKHTNDTLVSLLIPPDLKLSYSLATSSGEEKHKQAFQDLFNNFKVNLESQTQQRNDLRARVNCNKLDSKEIKLPLLTDKYSIRLSDNYTGLCETILHALVTRYSQEIRLPVNPEQDSQISNHVIGLFSQLKKLSDNNTSSNDEKLERSSEGEGKSEFIKSHISNCSNSLIEASVWFNKYTELGKMPDHLSDQDYQQHILLGEYSCKRDRDYLT